MSCFLPLLQARVFDLTLVSKQKYRKSSLETLACAQATHFAILLSSLIARQQQRRCFPLTIEETEAQEV